jgi:hypothetical protein
MGWRIYIPDEGHWPIAGEATNYQEAKDNYLKWAGRKNLPRGSSISFLANEKPKEPPEMCSCGNHTERWCQQFCPE